MKIVHGLSAVLVIFLVNSFDLAHGRANARDRLGNRQIDTGALAARLDGANLGSRIDPANVAALSQFERRPVIVDPIIDDEYTQNHNVNISVSDCPGGYIRSTNATTSGECIPREDNFGTSSP